jgi:hypothetical protein
MDGSNNSIVGPFGTGVFFNNNVFSLGDFGINPQRGFINKLKPWMGVPAEMGSLTPLAVSPALSPGITAESLGELRRVVAKFQIDYTAWTAAARNQQVFWTFPPKTRVCGIIADTTEAYAGISGPIELMAGTTLNDESYLKIHVVSSGAVTKGLIDADLGNRLIRANAVQGGDMQSWTSYNFVAVTLSASANLGDGTATHLSAGSTTVYIVIESMP